MSDHAAREGPAWRYYESVVGAWQGDLMVLVTTQDSPTEPSRRIGLLAKVGRRVLWVRQYVFGPLRMNTRVSIPDGEAPARVLHETWISGRLLRFFRSREWITPAPDGRHGAMTLDAWWFGIPAPRGRGQTRGVVVSADALRAEYEFRIAGVLVRQSGRRDDPANTVVLEQLVQGVAFRVALRREHEP